MKELGVSHIVVHRFENVCKKYGVTRRLIFKWGSLIDQDVKKRNENNLAVATGHTKDTAQELSDLKIYVSNLEEKFDNQTKELKSLLQEQNSLLAQLVEDKKQQSNHQDEFVASPHCASARNTVGFEMMEAGDNIAPVARVSPAMNFFQKRQSAVKNSIAAKADHGAVKKASGLKKFDPTTIYIPLAQGQSANSFSTVEFLKQVAEKGIDVVTRKGQVFLGGVVNKYATGKARDAFVFLVHHSRSEWKQCVKYGADATALHAKKDFDKSKEVRDKLEILCQAITKTGQKVLLEHVKRSEKFSNAKLKGVMIQKAKGAAYKICVLGGRVQKIKGYKDMVIVEEKDGEDSMTAE